MLRRSDTHGGPARDKARPAGRTGHDPEPRRPRREIGQPDEVPAPGPVFQRNRIGNPRHPHPLRPGQAGGSGTFWELELPAETLAELERRGHLLDRWGPFNERAGHAHGITIDPVSGMRAGGSDPRSDGAAIGY